MPSTHVRQPRRGAFRPCLAAVCSVLLLVAVSWLPAPSALQFDGAQLQQRAQARWGERGARNVSAWLAMLSQQRGRAEREQLQAVNDFWNRHVMGSEDSRVWGQSDYWATPLETLGMRAGDCEDFVIGKYFSLRYLGVAPEKLRFVYVRARVAGQSIAHMVLGYYPDDTSEPLVLDNLSGSILPASQRRDLTPVFSFNAEGVYVQGAQSAPADRIGRWRGLIERMQREGFQP